MKDKISRREFIKLAGLGTAASAALSGDYWLRRNPDHQIGDLLTPLIPEKEIATTCSRCPAGCGMIIMLEDGRVQNVKPNPIHPMNCDQLCPYGWSVLDPLDSPLRLHGPVKVSRSKHDLQPIDWNTAEKILTDAFHTYDFNEIAFILGSAPDHLHDVLELITHRIDAGLLLRYSAMSELTAQVTLMDAVQSIYGISRFPYIDLQSTDLIFSFGATNVNPWLTPPAVWREQQIHNDDRPYVVQFGPRRSMSGFIADEWIPIKPGAEAAVASALEVLIYDRLTNDGPVDHHLFDLNMASEHTGIPIIEFERLADMFIEARRKFALPGSSVLGDLNGLAACQKILGLNSLTENLGELNGFYILPDLPIHAEVDSRPDTMAQVIALIERIKVGKIKVLMVHGVDIIKELPESLDVESALGKLERLISFSPLMNATARHADYIFPDHLPLESWGYQKAIAGADRWVVSALQPVVAPQYDTRATIDVLLNAFRVSRGDMFAELPFFDEASFLKHSLNQIDEKGGGNRSDTDNLLWKDWMDNGGWWPKHQTLMPAVPTDHEKCVRLFIAGDRLAETKSDEYQLYLYPILTSTNDSLGKQSSELKSVEVNPDTGREFDIGDGESGIVSSRYGQVTVQVKYNPYIVRDVIGMHVYVMTFGYEHDNSVYRLFQLLGDMENESGNLAFNATRVKLEKIDKLQSIKRIV